jgi:hypothetical protein
MCVITYILTTCVLYIDSIQGRMTQSLSSDLAATQSVSENTVRWALNNEYEQALRRPEYSRRVRQVGPNVTPVRRTSFSYRAHSQGGLSQCTSQGCSTHEGRIATMETLLRAQTERNEALEQRMRYFETLEQRMRHIEAILTSMGVSHTRPSTQQSPPPNGGGTSSVSSGFASMITIV